MAEGEQHDAAGVWKAKEMVVSPGGGPWTIRAVKAGLPASSPALSQQVHSQTSLVLVFSSFTHPIGSFSYCDLKICKHGPLTPDGE